MAEHFRFFFISENFSFEFKGFRLRFHFVLKRTVVFASCWAGPIKSVGFALRNIRLPSTPCSPNVKSVLPHFSAQLVTINALLTTNALLEIREIYQNPGLKQILQNLTVRKCCCFLFFTGWKRKHWSSFVSARCLCTVTDSINKGVQ